MSGQMTPTEGHGPVSRLIRGDLALEPNRPLRPFARPRRLQRLTPFAAVAVVAWASAWLPPGPSSVVLWSVSLAVGLAASVAVWLSPWESLPSFLDLVPTLGFVAAYALLIDSTGGVEGGLMLLLLVAVAWAALYHRRGQTYVVVAGVLAAVATLSGLAADGWDVTSRRVVLWCAISLVLAESIQALRRHLVGLVTVRDQLLVDTSALERAARELDAALDPMSVIACVVRQAAGMATSAATGVRGRSPLCEYILLDGDFARVVDVSGLAEVGGFRLGDNPYLARVVAEARPRRAAIILEDLTPRVRSMVSRLGLTHAAFVPVRVDDEVHGVIAVLGRGGEVSEVLYERLVALGSLTELSLRRALDYEVQRQQATTDPLTGLPNCHAFREWHYRRGGRRPFAILAIDLDDLAWVNSTVGRDAGDRCITATARALSTAMRQGDVLARFGGDEFAALVFDASEEAGRAVAERMLSTLGGVRIEGHDLRASIGLAIGRPGDDPDAIFKAADSALNEAKGRGGMCYVLAAGSG